MFKGPQIVSSYWSNLGLVLLNNNIAYPQKYHYEVIEHPLFKALQNYNANKSASRALGFIYAVNGQEDRAVEMWQPGGSTLALELIDWGQRTVQQQQPQEAILWYERAARVDPQLGDPWFFLGQIYENEGNWSAASSAYQKGLESGKHFIRSGRSSLLLQLGQVEYEMQGPGQAQKVLEMYDLALKYDDFSNNWSRTQSQYRRGEMLSLLGRKEEAAASFAQVIEERPDDYWAYTKLGALTWELDQDASKAEAILLKALSIEDQNKFTYLNLGQLYLETQRFSEALEMYQKVLIIDPEDPAAREKVREIHEIVGQKED